jgi:hypothetical protein
MLEGYVHAQPSMTKQADTLRGSIFRPWTKRKCPFLIDVDTPDEWPKYKDTDRDICTTAAARDYKWQYHDITVTMNYKKNIKSVLVEPNGKYYEDAVRKIMCDNYTSYVGSGISFSSSRHADGNGDVDDYTEVTCTIAALLTANAYKVKWNPLYYKYVYDNESLKRKNVHDI